MDQKNTKNKRLKIKHTQHEYAANDQDPKEQDVVHDQDQQPQDPQPQHAPDDEDDPIIDEQPKHAADESDVQLNQFADPLIHNLQQLQHDQQGKTEKEQEEANPYDDYDPEVLKKAWDYNDSDYDWYHDPYEDERRSDSCSDDDRHWK